MGQSFGFVEWLDTNSQIVISHRRGACPEPTEETGVPIIAPLPLLDAHGCDGAALSYRFLHVLPQMKRIEESRDEEYVVL